MKRKIVSALLVLFLFSATGAILATFFITHSTATLSRLVTLHQIEDLRQHLIISIQTVQSDLYTVHTKLGQKIDAVVDNVSMLAESARNCTSCHHEPGVNADILAVGEQISAYQEALSYYITASANRERIEGLQLDAAAIGNQILASTENMSIRASQNLEEMTRAAMEKIEQAKAILFSTIILSFLFAVFTAVHLIRSVTGPIEKMVSATRALASGDLSHVVPAADRTEFGELARHFNTMSSTLRNNYARLLREVEERRLAEAALLESEERYAIAASGANDGLWDLDLRTNSIYYSYRWKSMLGYGDEEIAGKLEEWLERVHDLDREHVEAKLTAHINGHNDHFECEYRIYHKNNSLRWMLARGLAVRDERGTAYRMAGSQTDITARKSVEEQLIHDAFHDAMTNLPNRALFLDRLQQVVNTAKRHPEYFYAVLFTDLDRFKFINDSLGHEVGDKLLIEIGSRLYGCLRPGDTVARLGGDEFAIILEDIAAKEDAELIAGRILEAVNSPVEIDGHDLFLSQSIGIALKSDCYECPEEILRDADIAMYRAKAKGGGCYVFFDASMHVSILKRNNMEADLQVAIKDFADFVIHYQPIMNLRGENLSGFEALVRWQHDSLGLVSPNEFIPLAEETGIIIPLSKWIIKESCSQLQCWQDLYPSSQPLKMSVNITTRLLMAPGFVDYIKACLNEYELVSKTLILEITESVILDHSAETEDTLRNLQKLGVHIHIDDFGTGYSSLSYLHDFPVNGLKIDRSFIKNMAKSSENAEIVKTIVALAHNLKLDVIAEGLELDAQLSTIRGLDCNFGQGFFFSKPLDAEAISLWIVEKSMKFAEKPPPGEGLG
ncbi:MAG: EAL domain-containing protein [Desulfurivibrionaceae bacterium]